MSPRGFHAGQLGAIHPAQFSQRIKNLTCCIITADLNLLEVVKLEGSNMDRVTFLHPGSALKVFGNDLRSVLHC